MPGHLITVWHPPIRPCRFPVMRLENQFGSSVTTGTLPCQIPMTRTVIVGEWKAELDDDHAERAE